MAHKLNYSSKSLLNTTFTKNVRGYNALEVDKALDKVIEDLLYYELTIQEYSKRIENLTIKCNNLEKSLREKDMKIARLENQLPSLSNDTKVSRENINLLKRIDALEKALYNLGEDPSKIK